MTIVDTRVLEVVGGVDTHVDFHVAAALDQIGGLLGIESFETTEAGYRKLLGWLEVFGPVTLVGVEGTGSYGTGLSRFLHDHEIDVVEVDRPNRQLRHRKGKSDPTDAVAAARAALSGQATGKPKTRNGPAEQMRVLLGARRSARDPLCADSYAPGSQTSEEGTPSAPKKRLRDALVPPLDMFYRTRRRARYRSRSADVGGVVVCWGWVPLAAVCLRHWARHRSPCSNWTRMICLPVAEPQASMGWDGSGSDPATPSRVRVA